jgi:predicted ester cyclase
MIIGTDKPQNKMDLKQFARDWFANIDKQNWTAIEPCIDAQHKFRNSMTPQPIGKAEHLGMMQMMTSAFTGAHTLNVVFADADHVAISGRWKGKHTGDFNGIPATGNDVDFTFVDLMHVVNGKVVNEHMELNPMTIMQQVGAMQPAAAH